MRTRFFLFALTALVVSFAGCAAGFRAGGPTAGVGAGAAIGPRATPLDLPTEPVPAVPPRQAP